MTAAGLLTDLRDAGVIVTAAIDLDGPVEVLSDELIEAARRLKPHLLRLLVVDNEEVTCGNDGKLGAASADYTDHERHLLANASPGLRTTIDEIRATFAETGGATVIEVSRATGPQPDGRYLARNPCHQPVIDLIRPVARTNLQRAADLTAAWKERLAICEDSGLLPKEAERVALQDLATDVARISERNDLQMVSSSGVSNDRGTR